MARLLGALVVATTIPSCLIDPAPPGASSGTGGGGEALTQSRLAGAYSGTWSGTGSAGDPIHFTLDSAGNVTSGSATISGNVIPLHGQLFLQDPATGKITGNLIFDSTPFTAEDVHVTSPGQGGKNYEIHGTMTLNFVLDVSGP